MKNEWKRHLSCSSGTKNLVAELFNPYPYSRSRVGFSRIVRFRPRNTQHSAYRAEWHFRFEL